MAKWVDSLLGAVESGVSDIGNNYKVIPANSYSLPSGPATKVNYVPQTGTIPIIGSDVNIRSYSPFTLSILPPLLYLQNPDLLLGQTAQPSVKTANGSVLPPINLGIIGKASIRNLTNFQDTVTRLRSLKQDNSQGNRNGLSPPTQTQTNTVVGGRLKKPIGGSGGGTSDTANQSREPAITDRVVARDIAAQLNRILNVPPLTLYINPSSFGRSTNKVQQFQERSRSGYIYQTWGEEQPKLSVQGKIGAFIAGRANSTQQNVATGVQFASKRDSASFQQLMNLLTFFKNNGYIQDTIGKTLAPLLVGVVSIDYDQNTYIGSFDSFQWGYTETAQNGGLDFSFEFTVTQQYDNAQSNSVKPLKSPTPSPSDPRYGQQQTTTIGNQQVASNPNQQPATLPSLWGGAQDFNASLVSSVNQAQNAARLTVPTSSYGFQPPAISAAIPADSVPVQPFFDPRTV